jgi:hypothetical protein
MDPQSGKKGQNIVRKSLNDRMLPIFRRNGSNYGSDAPVDLSEEAIIFDL